MGYDALITYFLEIIAALAGFYYLKRHMDSKLRPLVYFLVFTLVIEAVGSYTNFIKIFKVLEPINNTIFKENFWLYNFFIIISLLFYVRFYHHVLVRKSHKNILNILSVLSVLIVSASIYIHGLFDSYLKYNFLLTSFCVFICVTLYFYEILMSNEILKFYKAPLFYISIGLLIWWLVFPLMIFYMPYYKQIYPEVVNIRAYILIGTNVILYGCYTVGFLYGKE